MRITESQIRNIIRKEIRNGMKVNESASVGALDALNAAFNAFMDAGGTVEELVDNAAGFAEDWGSSQSDMYDEYASQRKRA